MGAFAHELSCVSSFFLRHFTNLPRIETPEFRYGTTNSATADVCDFWDAHGGEPDPNLELGLRGSLISI